MSCLDRINVGDVLIAGSFVLSPADVMAHEQAKAMAGLLDRPGVRSGFPAEFQLRAMGGARTPAGAGCPQTLLVERAVASIQKRFGKHGMRTAPVRDLRVFAPPVIGEPIAVVANVRYRSEREGTGFLTLRVDLRRRLGSSLASFELGIEILGERVAESDRSATAA